jgi:hypothetical protein
MVQLGAPRVTRLDEFSLISINFVKNGLGYSLGDFFSQTHLVTLGATLVCDVVRMKEVVCLLQQFYHVLLEMAAKFLRLSWGDHRPRGLSQRLLDWSQFSHVFCQIQLCPVHVNFSKVAECSK